MKKKYRVKQTITAYSYEEGKENGFEIRYSDGKIQENGSMSTWMISYEDTDIEIKVPYVLDKNGRKILVGKNYMIIEEDGYPIKAINIPEFQEIYEEIK